MLPSQTQLHGHGWWNNMDYSFKHSYNWPGPGLADAAKAQAQAAGATAAESAAASAAANAAHSAHFAGPGGIGGGLPPHGPHGPGMHYHWYGRHGRYGRWRGPSRLIWFGLGFGAAAWYHHVKEETRRSRRTIASDGLLPESGWGCENVSKDHWGWHHGWHRSTPSAPTPANPVNNISPPSYPTPVKESPAEVVTESAVLAALNHARKEDVKPEDERQRHWGWMGRHQRRREAREAREEARRAEEAREITAALNTSAPTEKADSGEEMKRLRAAVEDLWADRRGAILTAQEKADQKARDYAREKIDRLSVALENLKDSLNTEGSRKKPNEKLV